MLEIKEGLEFKTVTSGFAVVLKYANFKEITIRFLETGSIVKTQGGYIRTGRVKDYEYPSVCGVGVVGIGVYKTSCNGKPTPEYVSWINMIKRCYSDAVHAAQPYYSDCEVCEEWQNFQTFAAWREENYIDGHVLDKDIKIQGNRTYSPEACMYVTKGDNSRKAHEKRRLNKKLVDKGLVNVV